MWTLLCAVPDALQLIHRKRHLAYIVSAGGLRGVSQNGVDARVALAMTATTTVYNLCQKPLVADCTKKCDNGADWRLMLDC
jgi:hypothetical protein